MRLRAVRLSLLVLVILLFGTSASEAQYGRRPSREFGGTPAHRLEIIPFGGYAWTTSREVWLTATNWGRVDIKNSGFWGIMVDINTPMGGQVELLYQRQESDLTYKETGRPAETVSGVTVDYWQIGGLSGVRRDKFMGFGGVTLGATHLMYDRRGFDDDWRFSMIFALGAKVYASDRLGLRVQGRLPFTFISGGGSIGCGTGGCYTTVGGEGVTQLDLSAGLMILL